MNTRMMFERVVAGRFLDRIYKIDRIKKEPMNRSGFHCRCCGACCRIKDVRRSLPRAGAGESAMKHSYEELTK